MEKLIIHIPEQKSILVKQLLQELGVTFQLDHSAEKSSYQAKLLQVTVWDDEAIGGIEAARNSFDGFTPQQW